MSDRDMCVRQDSCTRQDIYVHKNFGKAKARRQAPPLPHGSYATGITVVEVGALTAKLLGAAGSPTVA